MPRFNVGVTKTALLTLSNPTPDPQTYVAKVYLGVTQVAFGEVEVTVPANSQGVAPIRLTMPASKGTWPVFIDVKTPDGLLLAHLQASEPVEVWVEPAVTIGPITWE